MFMEMCKLSLKGCGWAGERSLPVYLCPGLLHSGRDARFDEGRFPETERRKAECSTEQPGVRSRREGIQQAGLSIAKTGRRAVNCTHRQAEARVACCDSSQGKV